MKKPGFSVGDSRIEFPGKKEIIPKQYAEHFIKPRERDRPKPMRVGTRQVGNSQERWKEREARPVQTGDTPPYGERLSLLLPKWGSGPACWLSDF